MKVASASELIRLRSDGQWSELFLAGLEAPRVIFAARVNQSFPSHTGWNSKARDEILQISYNAVTTGAYENIIAGMTLWIGSAAGLCDVGQARIRKTVTPPSSVLHIGEESDIDWDNGLYLTVIDEFGLWPKHVKFTGGVPYMDGDVAYSDQHSDFDPVPVMGSDAVLDVESYPVTLAFDASDSWVPGGTITNYAWTKTNGAFDNAALSTPTLTVNSYPTNGLIRIGLTVTADNGKTTTGYRYVRVYDATHPPTTDFQIGSLEGDVEAGGWEFDITMIGDVSTVRNRAPVIVFARDYYGDDRVEIGVQPGRKNIVCAGWIDGESIQVDPNENVVRFTVKGAQYWLDRMPGFPPGVEMQKTTGAWTSIPGLTVDRALWHLFHWRSTATTVIDIYLTGNTFLASAFEVPTMTLWQQIIEIAQTSILAVPCVDRYGRLYVEIDPQMVPVSDRTYTEVMTIEKQDWIGQITFERRVVNEVAMLDLSGVAVTAVAPPKPIFSLAPGHIFTRYGDIEVLDRMLLSTQVQANELAGLAMGKRNNPIPGMDISLAANNRLLDLCPRHYCNITIDASDNQRGIAYSGRIISRSISVEWNAETGTLLSTVAFEPESFPSLAIDGDPPANNPTPPTPPPPAPPPVPPIGGGIPTDGVTQVIIATTEYGILYTIDFDSDEPTWYYMNIGLSDEYSKNVVRLIPSSDGSIFAVVTEAFGSHNGASAIYVASALGAEWNLLVGGSSITEPDDYPVIGFGVDDSGNCIAILLGEIESLRGTAHVFIGNSGGVGESSQIAEVKNLFSDIVYGNGNWFYFMHSGQVVIGEYHYIVIDAGGQPVGGSNKILPQKIIHSSDHTFRLGNNIIRAVDSTTLYSNSGISPTGWVEVDTTGSVSGLNGTCALCMSPKGVLVGQGLTGIVGKMSGDLGYSWSPLSNINTGYTHWANGGDDANWLAATVQSVLYTNDNSANWYDKSGNLPNIASACHIYQIAVVGYEPAQ